MKKQNLCSVLLFFFMFLFSQCVKAEVLYKKKILLINSYDSNYGWTNNIVKNIANSLKDDTIYVEYMDTKRFPPQKIFNLFFYYLKEKYKGIKLDLVIVSDNNALNFVVQYKDTPLFYKLPVVFCGINKFKESMLKGYKDITGVVERIDVRKNVALILQLQPYIKNIVVIVDNRPSTEVYLSDVTECQKKYKDKIRFIVINGSHISLKDFLYTLKKMNKKNTAILFFTLFKLKDVPVLTYKEGISLVSKNVNIPIYEFLEEGLNMPGVVGGVITSSRLQAKYASFFARQILDLHLSPEVLPVLKKVPTEIVLDYRELKRFGISIDNVPEDAVLLNSPSFLKKALEKRNKQVIVLIFILVLLLLLFFLFIFSFEKIRKLQRQLMDKNEQFEALINGSKDIICLKDGKGRWLIANNADITLFNLKDVDYHGKTDRELAEIVPEFRDAFFHCMETDKKAWENGKPTRSTEIIKDKTGVTRIFDIVKTPIFDEYGNRKYLIVIGRDITEYKELEKQLLHSQKMELLGVIASGIAHDFNNILATLTMSADIIKLKTKDESLKRYVKNFEKGLNSAAELINRIKALSYKEHIKFEPIDFRKVIDNTFELVKGSIPSNISVDFEYNKKENYFIWGNLNHLSQAVMNIVLNARDAIIEANRDEGKISIIIYKRDDKLIVKIRDNGCGIPEKYINKIFYPFFTTKDRPNKKGSGLGLSIVSRIIEQHNGTISVHSKEGEGSVFVMEFPLIKDIIAPKEEKREMELEVKGELKGKTVLVIDDEEDILNLSKEILTMLGLNVLTTKNGEKGIDILKKEKVDIVFVDWMMPILNGERTILEINKMDIHPKIFIVSGQIDDKIEEFKRAKLVSGVIHKPFTIEELVKKLNSIKV